MYRIGDLELEKIVGKRRAQQYVYGGILVYLLIYAGIVYLQFGSVTAVVRVLLQSSDEPDWPLLVIAGNWAAFLTAFSLRVLLYSRTVGFSLRKCITIGVFLSVAVAILGSLVGAAMTVLLAFPLFLLGDLILALLSLIGGIDVPPELYQNAAFTSSFIVGFGLTALVFIARSYRSIPERICEPHAKLDAVLERIDEAEAELADSDYATASEILERAETDLDTARRTDDPLSSVAERSTEVEDRLRTVASRVTTEAISAGRADLDRAEYTDAYDALTVAEATASRFGLAEAATDADSLLKQAGAGITDTAADLETAVVERLERAEDARRSGDGNRAREQLDAAEVKYFSLKKYLGDRSRYVENPVDGSDSDDLYTRITDRRRAVERDEQERAIQDQRVSVADALGVDTTRIRIEPDSIEGYELLTDTVGSLQSARTAYPSVPWDELESELERELPGLTRDQLDDYRRLVSGAEEILAYLETVDQSHPSVDAEEWRTAVTTALEEQYPNVLDPITARIDRLKSGLWRREQLYEVSWEEFERLIGSLYEDRGYAVEVTRETADMGVDVWAEKGGRRLAIQVKQYGEGNSVGRQTLQQLVSTIAKGDADAAVVVTSGEFARTAVQYAADFGPDLELIDGEGLVEMLSESEIPPPL